MTGIIARALLLLSCLCLCQSALAQGRGNALPDRDLTPGDALAVTTADLCRREYKNPDRHVPIELKCRVFARYHMTRYETGYNVDHLIPPRLGGSNAIANLWPQPLGGEWDWQRKNRLERQLRKLVCGGQLDLHQAQQEIATDWISAYKKYIGEPQSPPPETP